MDCEKNQNQRSTFSNSINPKSEIYNAQSVYGFKIASYDKTKELIIDPLLASTYLGGLDSDYGYSMAIDADKNIIVAGYTKSSDFPTTSGSYNTSKGVFFDAFISKLSSDLTSLIASTYLGGYYRDIARSIAIDSDGNIYVAGETRSSNFPTTPGSYDISYTYDAFVSKLDSNLSTALIINKKQ